MSRGIQQEGHLPFPPVTNVTFSIMMHGLAHMRAHARAWSSLLSPMPGDMVTESIRAGRMPHPCHLASGDIQGGVTR
jgi:hypothetical protein